jgi:hypothetical protein
MPKQEKKKNPEFKSPTLNGGSQARRYVTNSLENNNNKMKRKKKKKKNRIKK